jgi:peptidoglycan hydrolase-like protein with peptidoglycan-binding domain
MALVLGFSVALGTGAALAQDIDRTPDRSHDQGTYGANRERGAGYQGEKPETGVLKLSTDDVMQVERVLAQRGYNVGPIDGKRDSALDDAIGKFQKDIGIEQSGHLDMATLNALGFGAVVALSKDVEGANLVEAPKVEGGVGVTERPAGLPLDANVVGTSQKPLGFLILDESQIKAIQSRLKSEGLYKGDANGKITQDFLAAMQQFKRAKGIESPGLFDVATLAWFPEAKIKVDLTGKPESELNVPAGMPKPGMEDQRVKPGTEREEPTAPGGALDRETPGGGTGHGEGHEEGGER